MDPNITYRQLYISHFDVDFSSDIYFMHVLMYVKSLPVHACSNVKSLPVLKVFLLSRAVSMESMLVTSSC